MIKIFNRKSKYFVCYEFESIDKEDFIHKGKLNTIIVYNKIKTEKHILEITLLIKRKFLSISNHKDAKIIITNINKV